METHLAEFEGSQEEESCNRNLFRICQKFSTEQPRDQLLEELMDEARYLKAPKANFSLTLLQLSAGNGYEEKIPYNWTIISSSSRRRK